MQLTRLVSPYVQLLSALRSLPWELDSEASYMWGCQDGTGLTAVLCPCEHRHSFVPGPWPTLLISEMGARDLSPETQSRTHSSSRPGLPGWPRGWGEHSRGAFGGSHPARTPASSSPPAASGDTAGWPGKQMLRCPNCAGVSARLVCVQRVA